MLASTARYNSSLTARAYELRRVVEVRAIPEQVEEQAKAQAEGRYAMKPNFEVLGECGHRLMVVAPHQASTWEAKVAQGKRKRCEDCVRDQDAHQARLVLGG